MTREPLLSILGQEPFRPVTVHTSSGASYLVARREEAWLSPQGDALVISTGGEGFVMIAMDHITSLGIGGPEVSES